MAVVVRGLSLLAVGGGRAFSGGGGRELFSVEVLVVVVFLVAEPGLWVLAFGICGRQAQFS